MSDLQALWKPIETAPTDGTRILVADRNAAGGWVEAARYHGDYGGWWMVNTDPTDYYDGQVYPTVWQPMPDPPSSIR